MRSSWMRNSRSFLKTNNREIISTFIRDTARKYGVKIYKQAIHSNHLHLLVVFAKRKSYVDFIRVLSGKIASYMMNYRSFKDFIESLGMESVVGEVQGKGQAFWQFRPFTRIISWGRDFRNCCDYLKKNIVEALGFIRTQIFPDFDP